MGGSGIEKIDSARTNEKLVSAGAVKLIIDHQLSNGNNENRAVKLLLRELFHISLIHLFRWEFFNCQFPQRSSSVQFAYFPSGLYQFHPNRIAVEHFFISDICALKSKFSREVIGKVGRVYDSALVAHFSPARHVKAGNYCTIVISLLLQQIAVHNFSIYTSVLNKSSLLHERSLSACYNYPFKCNRIPLRAAHSIHNKENRVEIHKARETLLGQDEIKRKHRRRESIPACNYAQWILCSQSQTQKERAHINKSSCDSWSVK